jgi:hypothetical protein
VDLAQALRKADLITIIVSYDHFFLEFADLMSAIRVEVRSISRTSKCGNPSMVLLEVLYLLGCAMQC